MSCIIYVRQTDKISLYEQFNKCAEYAKRYGYSIEHKILDFEGNQLHMAVDKAVFSDDIKHFIAYSRKAMSDSMEDVLFHQIYMVTLGVDVHFVE